MTEMFGEAWSPMSVPDLAPDDDDDVYGNLFILYTYVYIHENTPHVLHFQPLIST